MPKLFTVEELVIDDSFYCYCLSTAAEKNNHDFWQQYVTDNPSEKKNIEEARLIVLGLYSMLQQRKAGAPLHALPLPPALHRSYTVNSLLMACTLYSSRIALIIAGVCITTLIALYSIPVLQATTVPGLFPQLSSVNGYCSCLKHLPLMPPAFCSGIDNSLLHA